ncbi:hypothetical protein TIFTF001_002398 [Ficus carica]|uniref:Uncharacterized protein n=1 Tax=Ficus carica TaxID=3494 RepID=A0AA87ZMK1_FICCA|nr:hypothetical protein TIFTF001_002398 [Ficus carica]
MARSRLEIARGGGGFSPKVAFVGDHRGGGFSQKVARGRGAFCRRSRVGQGVIREWVIIGWGGGDKGGQTKIANG